MQRGEAAKAVWSPFWTIQVGAWAAYGASTYLTTLPRLAPDQYLLVAGFKGIRTGLGFGLSVVLWQFYRMVERQQPSRIIRLACISLASSAAGLVWLMLYQSMTAPIRPLELMPYTRAELPRAALDHVFVLLCWSVSYFAIRAYLFAERAELQRYAAESRARASELQMLRYQLNPHFLFNVLNSIRAVIPSSAMTARTMVDSLAGFLRHALQSSNGDAHTSSLQAELDAARSYLAIENVRFSERLQVEFDIAPDVPDASVPVLLLHPLVENAVKHGLASDARPLRIRVGARRDGAALVVEVENTLGARTSAPGMGIGLDNVRRRLALVDNGRCSFDFKRDLERALATVRIEQA